MNDHECYEILCALEATGQLAGPESADFDEHCVRCTACREKLQDFISVGAQLQLDPAVHETEASLPEGSLERFRARAIREGIAPRVESEEVPPLYALASGAAIFFIIAAMIFMPHGRRSAERSSVSDAPPISARQRSFASVARGTNLQQSSKFVHAHFSRHNLAPPIYRGCDEASVTAPRFPQALTASYPFFGSQSVTSSTFTGYPALRRSQMSRLNLFHTLDHSNSRNPTGVARADLPIDMASTGTAFDFSANIRQLHFQLSTAQ